MFSTFIFGHFKISLRSLRRHLLYPSAASDEGLCISTLLMKAEKFMYTSMLRLALMEARVKLVNGSTEDMNGHT